MTLGSIFRRAQTSAPIRLLTFSAADRDSIVIWRTFADISAGMRHLTPPQQKTAAGAIIDRLDAQGWDLRPAADGTGCGRRKLALFMESQLTGAHEMAPLHDLYGKFIGKYLRANDHNGAPSFDFLHDNLAAVKDAAAAVLRETAPAGGRPPAPSA